MAKKSLIEAEKRKRNLFNMHAGKIRDLRDEIRKGRCGLAPDFVKIAKLRKKIPRNAFPNRARNRCFLTGRPRAYIRYFGICRHEFRRLALAGLLPGVRKSGV